MSTRLTLVSVSLATFVILFAALFSIPKPALSQAASPINGYAWSDTAGWIDLNCTNTNTCASSNFGLSVAADGTVSGYAWSEHIGWIKFGGLSGFPAAGGNAQITGNNFTGWARACAGTVSGDCASADRTDGWDGWIALNDPSGSAYGVTLSAGNFNSCQSGSTSCAWGDVSVGWISFGNASTTFQACSATQGNVCLDANTSQRTDAQCTVTTDVCTTHGTGWFCSASNSLCNPPPPPTSNLGGGNIITALPKIIRSGNTVIVSWNVGNATSCSVTGSNGDAWSGVTGAQTSRAITKQTTFALSCAGPGGSLTGSATVSLTPTFQER